MDDLMTALVERADSEQWPPLMTSGPEIRRRGRRRRLQHRVAYAGGVGAVAAAVVAVPLTVSSWQAGSAPDPSVAGIVQSQRPGEIESIFGVSVTLPAGWVAREIDAPSGQRRACLGVAPVDPDRCDVVFAVATDPDRAYADGIDPASLVGTDCAPGDPNIMTVTEQVVDGRNAHTWASQCAPGDPTYQEWALDNRTLAVVSSGSTWDSAAQSIFEQARTPAEWPHHDMEFTVATASPR
jgi:hypothetical protein